MTIFRRKTGQDRLGDAQISVASHVDLKLLHTYLKAQQVVHSADDDVDSCSVACLCSQVVLELC